MSERVFNDETVLVLAQGYRFQWEPAQNCNVLLYPEGMVKLNGGAGEIVKHISEKKQTVAELVAALTKAFDGADLAEDVYHFLDEAFKNDWLRK